MPTHIIRSASSTDAAAISRIYNPYIETTAITFEEVKVTEEEMARRIADVASAELPWLVLEVGNVLVGYAYATKWRARMAYRFSVESTVYLDPSDAGKGFGTILYNALLQELRRRGLHLVVGGIALPNAGSVALHEKLGFKKVAHFTEVGLKFGRWIDVGYWELNLTK